MTLLRTIDRIAPALGSVRVLAVTTASAALDISEFDNREVSFRATGGDVYLVFGAATLTASSSATTGDTRSYCLPSGQEMVLKIHTATSAFVAAITASGTAQLRMFPSSDSVSP